MSVIIVYVTFPTSRSAANVTSYLLKKKLVACAVQFPVRSQFVWKGKMRSQKEIVTFYKTRSTLWKRLKADIDTLHPDEVPCVLKVEVDAIPSYAKWVLDTASFDS